MQDLFKKIRPLIMWGTGDLYFILAVTVTILFGVLSPDLQKQLNLTSSELGFLGFGFFLSFGITQVLAGGLIDSLGPRLVLTIAAVIASIGLFLLATAKEFNQAILAQIVTGAGFSVSYVGAIYLASTWFSGKFFSLLSGLTLMSSNIVSATLITIMALAGMVTSDFRGITKSTAIAALIMALLLFLIIRKAPDSQSVKAASQKSMFWQDLSHLLQIPQFWFGALYFCATISVYLSFSSLWSVPSNLAYGHNLQTAAMMSATLRYGTAAGAFLSGLIASYTERHSLIARCYSTGALLVGIFLVFGPIFPVSIVYLLFALFGFFFGGAALGFPIVGQYIPPTLKGTGFGLMVALGYLLSALLEYLIGFLLHNQTSIDAFTIAFTPLVIMLAIGWFCTLRLQSEH